MTASAYARAAALRTWADGDLALEGAVELLIRALRGRLLDGPWIRSHDYGSFWFDADSATQEDGVLSGGERRVLAVAASLASSDHPVDLRDALTGLDLESLVIVLDALAHVSGRSGAD